MTGGEEHVLVWERGPLTELYTAIRDLAWKSASRRHGGVFFFFFFVFSFF